MTDYVTLNAMGASATLQPDRGGLLSSLKLMKPGGEPHELLFLPADFSAQESGWPGGGMPLMFPFAGRVFLGGEPFKYTLGGATYGMPLHGFAYGVAWQVSRREAASCTLTCSHGPATQLIYPYEFDVTAAYSLKADALDVALTVTHHRPIGGAPATMPVALGWHPYWRLPLPAGASLEKSRITAWARQEIQVTPAGAAGKAKPADATPWQATLAEPNSQNLILGDLSRPEATFEDGAGNAITMRVAPAATWQNWVLWRKDHGFQCVEPWMGLPDAVSTGAGLQRLAAGASLSLSMQISLNAPKP